MPRGDILLVAGDISIWRTNRQDIINFNTWLGTLPYNHKIVVAGNHDLALQDRIEQSKALLNNAIYLQDSGAIIEGLRIWGTPWRLGRGCCYRADAFGTNREHMRVTRENIPSDCDILITHSAPYGVADPEKYGHAGDFETLTQVTQRIKPQLHVFGHHHDGRGAWRIGETVFINAATALEAGDPARQPIVVTLLLDESRCIRSKPEKPIDASRYDVVKHEDVR